MFDFSHFVHGSKTVVIITIGFRCLGSSCLDIGLASAPDSDCLALVSTSLPLPRKNCLDSNPGKHKTDEKVAHLHGPQRTSIALTCSASNGNNKQESSADAKVTRDSVVVPKWPSAAILDIIEPKIAPFDRPTPKTLT